MTTPASQPPTINPQSIYETPDALAQDPLLEPARKLELLDRWEFNVNAELAAADEGMPISATREARASEIVRKIGAARRLVAEMADKIAVAN